MKSKVIDVKRLMSITLLLFTIGGLVISTPSAFAMSPSISGDPGSVVQNSLVDVVVGASAGFNDDIRQIQVVEFNPDNTAGSPGTSNTSDGNGGVCPLVIDSGVDSDARIWELREVSTENIIGVLLDFPTTNTATIPFGTGVGEFTLNAADLSGPGSNTWQVSDSDTGYLEADFDGNDVTSVEAFWLEVTANSPEEPSTDTLGKYFTLVCFEEANAVDTNNGAFFVVLPVGGTIIPINTTALLVSGMLTNPILSLLVIAGMATSTLVIIKLKNREKENLEI